MVYMRDGMYVLMRYVNLYISSCVPKEKLNLPTSP